MVHTAPTPSLRVEARPEPQYPGDVLHRFHWLPEGSGKTDEGYGRDVADAFSRLGYGGGAIRALDWWEVVPADGAPTRHDGQLRDEPNGEPA